MDNWNIIVRGTGGTGVDRMAADFVTRLKEEGHSVVAASITFGVDIDITDGVTGFVCATKGCNHAYPVVSHDAP